MLHDFLNPAQRKVVETVYGPVLVISGAGSGKTRVVTQRIAHLIEQGIPPSSILALTFTNKAAGEMKQRVLQLIRSEVLVCTFHSLGARILRESIHFLGYASNFTIYDAQDSEKLMKACTAAASLEGAVDVKEMLHLVSKAKNKMLAEEEAQSVADVEARSAFNTLYRLYQEKLKIYNAVDFDDLLYLPVRLFNEHPDVLESYKKRWSFLLVDEYQDTNEAQYAFVKLLAAGSNNLCAVGDPDQSIYSWRGANISNILHFENDFPGAVVVRLEQNYRSRSNILEASNAVISYNTSRYEKQLWSDRGHGEPIRHFTADTDRGEAEFIADKIRYHLQGGVPLKEIAVFYRTNAQSRPFEDSLLHHKIPYKVVGGPSFYQRKETKDILAFLRLVASDCDYVSFARTLNLPKRGIGDATIEKLRLGAENERSAIFAYCRAIVEDSPLQYPIKLGAKQKAALGNYISIILALREIESTCSLQAIVTSAVEKTGYLDHLKADKESYEDRAENVYALIAKAAEWEEAAPEPSLAKFLEELSLHTSGDDAGDAVDRVSLMTVHNSKGLEFDVVFLAGLEEDLFPHANARGSESALEEERRLCYVGMTRAREQLYLCNARQRFLWGTARTQRPSRFLREIPAGYVEKLSVSPLHRPYNKQEWKADREMRWKSAGEPFGDEITVAGSFNPGDIVYHHDFGIGKVTEAYESGAVGLVYKVAFTNDSSERTLVANLARLKKI